MIACPNLIFYFYLDRTLLIIYLLHLRQKNNNFNDRCGTPERIFKIIIYLCKCLTYAIDNLRSKLKNEIFVLHLPEYVQFGGAKLILNNTVTFDINRLVSMTASVMFPFHSPPNHPKEVSLQKYLPSESIQPLEGCSMANVGPQ